MQMNINPQNGLISLSIEKPLCFMIKKLSEQVSAWRNLFPDRETCFGHKYTVEIYVRRKIIMEIFKGDWRIDKGTNFSPLRCITIRTQ